MVHPRPNLPVAEFLQLVGTNFRVLSGPSSGRKCRQEDERIHALLEKQYTIPDSLGWCCRIQSAIDAYTASP